MSEGDAEARLAADKWKLQQAWEEARLEISRQELAKKPPKWLPGASLGATVVLALIATAATTANLKESRRDAIIDDQRKAIQAHVTEYIGLMLTALTSAQELTSNTSRTGIEPTDAEWQTYDHEMRQTLARLHLAGAKIYMERPDLQADLDVLWRRFRLVDDAILQMRTSSPTEVGANRRAAWAALDGRALSIPFLPTLEKFRPVLKRPEVDDGRSKPCAQPTSWLPAKIAC